MHLHLTRCKHLFNVGRLWILNGLDDRHIPTKYRDHVVISESSKAWNGLALLAIPSVYSFNELFLPRSNGVSGEISLWTARANGVFAIWHFSQYYLYNPGIVVWQYDYGDRSLAEISFVHQKLRKKIEIHVCDSKIYIQGYSSARG